MPVQKSLETYWMHHVIMHKEMSSGLSKTYQKVCVQIIYIWYVQAGFETK